MNKFKAEKVLHEYQKWRRGARIPMPCTRAIGNAIDVAIKELRKGRK